MDLFTAQNGLCLAAHYISKCSFDTPSLSPYIILSVSLWFWAVQGNSRTVWLLYCWCSTTEGIRAQMRLPQSARKMGHAPAVKACWFQNADLQSLSSLTLCFYFPKKKEKRRIKKKKKKKEKSFLQAAPQAFLWGGIKNCFKNKDMKKKVHFAQFKTKKTLDVKVL